MQDQLRADRTYCLLDRLQETENNNVWYLASMPEGAKKT
jgi:hypothetical protein